MSKKMITFAALAIGAIGAIGVAASLSPAQAGMVSAGHMIADAGKAGQATNINFKRRGFKHRSRGLKRHNRHVQRRAVRHNKWKHRNRFKRHNRHYRNRYLGSNGIYLARRSLCNQYYANAVYSGSHYWWRKYNNCIRRY